MQNLIYARFFFFVHSERALASEGNIEKGAAIRPHNYLLCCRTHWSANKAGLSLAPSRSGDNFFFAYKGKPLGWTNVPSPVAN